MRIDDSCLDEGIVSNICDRCIHRLAPEHRKCKAFNELIPIDIWQGRNDHTKPVEGDNGIQFEPIKD